ncbi:MAG: MerR family transcriptional regulator [bacterium]
MDNLERFLTTHEAARHLLVTPTTLISWIKQGHIRCWTTLGGHRRIPESEIDRIMEEMRKNKAHHPAKSASHN